MRLTQCVEVYGEFREVADVTRGRLKFSVRRWLKAGGRDDADLIDVADLDAFRVATKGTMSPTSIETTVRDIRLLLKIVCGRCLPVGRRLRFILPPPSPPTTADLDAVLSVCDQAVYPIQTGRAAYRDWGTASDGLAWRGFLLIGLFTGLRLGDLLGLEWRHVSRDTISFRASKTSTLHEFPIPAPLQAVLCQLREHVVSERVLPFRARRLIWRELTRLCNLAGVRPFGPQHLRQACVTSWSEVSDTCRAIIHGCGLGVTRFYVDPCRVLRSNMDRFPWPPLALPPEQRDERIRRLDSVRAKLDRVPLDQLASVERVVEAFAG